jgi:hypothetical protein
VVIDNVQLAEGRDEGNTRPVDIGHVHVLPRGGATMIIRLCLTVLTIIAIIAIGGTAAAQSRGTSADGAATGGEAGAPCDGRETRRAEAAKHDTAGLDPESVSLQRSADQGRGQP